jgi:hypothetical protein
MSKENIIQNIFHIAGDLNSSIKQLDMSECSEETKNELLESLQNLLTTLSELSPNVENNSYMVETEKMLNENILFIKEKSNEFL